MDKAIEEIDRLEREIIDLIDDIELYDTVFHPKIMLYKQQLYEKRMRLNELKRMSGLAS